VWWVAGGGRFQASLLLDFVSSLSHFRAGEVFVPPWVVPVEARVSQPLGLWSFEAPGLVPEVVLVLLVLLDYGVWFGFFSFLGVLCFWQENTPERFQWGRDRRSCRRQNDCQQLGIKYFHSLFIESNTILNRITYILILVYTQIRPSITL
jgi:hypothetical protein